MYCLGLLSHPSLHQSSTSGRQRHLRVLPPRPVTLAALDQTLERIWNGIHQQVGMLYEVTVPGLHRRNGRKEGHFLFNDALNTFYLRLYGVRHMVKDHSDSEKGNPLVPHRLLFPISSKGSFICIIRPTG